MKTIQIQKSRLEGSVCISGAKNSALKLLTASILTSEKVELYNSPNELLDMQVHKGMLEVLGKNVFVSGDYMRIEEYHSLNPELTWQDRSIRNSLLMLGCLTTRFGKGKVPLPGGCKLGERKYDIHINILEQFGATIHEEGDYLISETSSLPLNGTEIHLPIRSTGATENAILIATLAKGDTIIWNPHIRPEIIDLIELLNAMGAKIEVFGQKCIIVKGVEYLSGARHRAIPDNMEALTWAIGSVITGGDVEIIDFPFKHLEIPLVYLKESGMKYYRGDNSLIVKGGTPYPVEISTGPYPGINSDMQPLFAIYGAVSEGKSRIIDLRFPGRYAYAEQMAKLGISYKIDGDLLIVEGGNPLIGSTVEATDLRAGIALLIAGMVCEGETKISNAWQIERGYEKLGEKLKALNCNYEIK